jgi:acyl-coenzyme A thioesterase PaaI-like protein
VAEAERERLADSIRALVRATRVTETDPSVIDEARELIDRATGLLAARTFEGPHCQVGFGALAEGVDFSGPPPRWFPLSPVMGRCNALAPPVELDVVEEEVDGTTTRVVVGSVTLNEAYNGPPWDNTHGGVIAEIFDELLGSAAIAGAGGGYTGRLTINYRRPTPILRRLDLRAWVEGISGRKVTARGEIRCGDTITADAEGLFIKTAGTLTSSD